MSEHAFPVPECVRCPHPFHANYPCHTKVDGICPCVGPTPEDDAVLEKAKTLKCTCGGFFEICYLHKKFGPDPYADPVKADQSVDYEALYAEAEAEITHLRAKVASLESDLRWAKGEG